MFVVLTLCVCRQHYSIRRPLREGIYLYVPSVRLLLTKPITRPPVLFVVHFIMCTLVEWSGWLIKLHTVKAYVIIWLLSDSFLANILIALFSIMIIFLGQLVAFVLILYYARY